MATLVKYAQRYYDGYISTLTGGAIAVSGILLIVLAVPLYFGYDRMRILVVGMRIGGSIALVFDIGTVARYRVGP